MFCTVAFSTNSLMTHHTDWKVLNAFEKAYFLHLALPNTAPPSITQYLPQGVIMFWGGDGVGITKIRVLE